MQLARPEIAPRIAEYLRGQQQHGMQWVVYDHESEIASTLELTCFKRQRDAHAFVDASFAGPLHLTVDTIPAALKQLEETVKNHKMITGGTPHKKEENMNLNNLEDIKGYAADLKFDKSVIDRIEEGMRRGIPAFVVQEQYAGDRGIVDQNVYVRQSSQSDFYYLGKFDTTHTKGARPLEEKEKYMVFTKNPDPNGKNPVKPFLSPADAIAFFKAQKGTSELAIGTDGNHKTTLASMENGKINYVNRDFSATFHGKPVTQTFYVREGQGFNAVQARNLVQGRAVYREDLITRAGEPYKAWAVLDNEQPKDNNGNFRYRHFRDPEYGFDIQATLKRYGFKEADQEAFIAELKDGNRALGTVEKDGRETKLLVEAVPRYGNLNLFDKDGKPQRREEYDLEAKQDRGQSRSRGNEQEMASQQYVRL